MGHFSIRWLASCVVFVSSRINGKYELSAGGEMFLQAAGSLSASAA